MIVLNPPIFLPDSPRENPPPPPTAKSGPADDTYTNLRLSWINSCIHVLRNKNLHGFIRIYSTYKTYLQNLRLYRSVSNANLYDCARDDLVAIIEKIENRIDKTIWEKQNIIEKVILFCLPYHIAAFFECVDDDFRDGDTFPDNLYDYEEEIHANSEEIITDLLYFFNLEISNAGGGAAAGGDIDLQ